MTEHRLVGPDDADYPPGLRDLEIAPEIYVMGTMFAAPAVAVVGTRRCTAYGRSLAFGFGRALAGSGWITVSGMARGIDAMGHRGGLESGGPGVAVLGSGIDVVYPAENRDIYQRLAGGMGAVVSEYPPGTRPDRWRFPARNRIIAAIASAVVVVETGDRGGALITARMAAELGRPVLAVPGDVDRLVSVGCNRLIRDGAIPVLGSADLIEELELILGAAPRSEPLGAVSGVPETGATVDELAEIWGCGAAEAMIRVGRLELEGKVGRHGNLVTPVST
jgi:DNA processing protein